MTNPRTDSLTAILSVLGDRGHASMTAEERLSAWLEGYRDNDAIPADLFHDIKRARDALRATREIAEAAGRACGEAAAG